MGSWADLMSRLEPTLPEWATPRWKRLYFLDLTLDGRQYDHLEYKFETEVVNGSYIPIHDRRPSVVYPLPQILANNLANKLFSGRHWPTLQSPNDELDKDLDHLLQGTNIQEAMKYACVRGSVGSVAISFVFNEDDEVMFKVWLARHCVPIFDINNNLVELRIRYQTDVDSLISDGYEMKDASPDQKFWYGRKITREEDIVYELSPDDDPPDWNEWKIDKERSVNHGFGFVPAVWIENLMGGHRPDGDSTFRPMLDFLPEIDYQLSQIGRGFYYSAAPQLAIKGRSSFNLGPNTITTVRSPANIIELDPGNKDRPAGDAKLLEMTGAGLREALELVKLLRSYAIESCAGSRKDPERITAIPMSGKAMELLEEELIDLLQALRNNYGMMGLVKLSRFVSLAAAKRGVMNSYDKDDLRGLQLLWPKVYLPSTSEVSEFAIALTTALSTIPPVISPEVAIQLFGSFLDIPHSTLMSKTLDEIIKETLKSTAAIPVKSLKNQPMKQQTQEEEGADNGGSEKTDSGSTQAS